MNRNLFFDIKETRLKGICLYSDKNYIFINKKGKMVVYDNNEKYLFEVPLPISRLKRFFAKVRVFERLFHLTVRCGCLFDNQFIFAFNAKIYRLELGDRIIIQENVPVKGTPLSFCNLSGIKGFDDGLVIGDYSRNEQREEVNIYFRNSNRLWKKVYSFEKKVVRHIHNIIINYDRDGVYVLTGDDDSECGIWQFKDNFKTVEEVLTGKQKYRACQLLPTKDGFLYLTDMPFYRNKVIEYSLSTKTLTERSKIYGSCINGCIIDNLLIFSTTVEPNPKQKNRLKYWLTNKPGFGIEGNKVKVCALNEDGSIIELKSFVHDGLPLRLFQYGSAFFCQGTELSSIYFSPIAVRKYDYRLFKINFFQK